MSFGSLLGSVGTSWSPFDYLMTFGRACFPPLLDQHGSDRPQPGFTKFSGMQIDMYLFWLFRLDMYVDIWGASMVAELALPGAELSLELLP